MKKHFYPVIAATTLLMAASCSQDEEFVSGANGNEEVVTFTVNAGVATRAAGDGKTVNTVHYEVWDKNTQKLVISTIPSSGAMTSARAEGVQAGRASVSMSLVKGVPYDITFWAQNEEGSAYDISAGLDEIKLKDGPKANEEEYDAFFKTIVDYKVKSGSTTVELKRPFAQVNVGTAPTDWERAKALGVEIDQSTITVSGIHDQFNARSAEASGNALVTFALNNILDETFTVKDSTYQYLAMNYMLADSASTLHNMEVTFNDGTQVINTLSITNMPIQRNWRTNIVGRVLTSDEDFEIIILPEFEGDHNIYTANSSDELNRILRECTDDDIVIDLGTGVTRAAAETIVYDVEISAWVEPYYFGQQNTKTITINGNGHTINFVHKNTDWNYIRCVNDDTKWILNDLHLTNSGANNGPWNRHDIRFYNAVEMNNVTSDKAIALLNDGTLKNVDITEDGGVYGLWITAEGQNVDIDGLSITATNGGRGIKIGDQYVDSPEKVTLNVKNSKFNTANKAAVLVTSTAGADITWGEGNDISSVAADQINAVWVDSERAYYYDLVTVSGCTKYLEELDSHEIKDAQDLQNILAHPEVSEITLTKTVDNGSDVFSITHDLTLNMDNIEIKAGGQGTNNYAFNLYGNNVVVNEANINGAGFAVLDGASLDVNNSQIAAKPGKSGRNMFYVVEGSTVTVNEGTYTFDRTSCYFVYVDANSTCYIKGGHFEKPLANNASKDSFVNNASTGKVIITGGTFNVDPTKWLADGYKATKSGKIWTVSAE